MAVLDKDFDALYREYRPYLWAICYRLLGNSPDTEEAVQETFVRAAAWFSDRPLDPTRIKGWLSLTARRCSIDLLRQRSKTTEIPDIPRDEPLLDPVIQALQECPDRLPQQQRLVLVLKHVEKLSWSELVAETEGWSKTQDQWRYLDTQARTAMQKCMKNCLESD